jgi:hypothetical protein
MSTTPLQTAERETSLSQRGFSPHFLLRVAGLPFDAVESLRFAATARWADEVLSLEARMEARRELLVDALHIAVHETADEPARQRKLINLKRDVFNRRAPKDVAAARGAMASLDADAGATLEQWLQEACARTELLRCGQQILDDEGATLRARLKEVVQHPDFRHGLLISSPTLDRDVDHYLKATNKKLNRRLRLAERSILLYLLRTACKTSPFSTLNSVTDGVFESDETQKTDASIAYVADDMTKKSFIQLNVAALSRLSVLLLESSEISKNLPVCLNKGWDIEGNRIRYLRNKTSISGTNTPQAFDSVEESIFYLPLSPTVMRLIECLGGGRTVKMSDLVLEISDGAASEREKVETLLLHLLRLGMLVVPGLHLPLSDPLLLSRYRRELAKFANPLVAEVAARLEKVESLVGGYADAPHAERRASLESIKQEFQACFALLGGDEADVPRTLLYEDSTIAPQRLAASRSGWRQTEAALADVQRLLPVFDPTLGNRLVTNAFFKVIYGEGQRCDDVLSFAETFSQDYYREYMSASPRRSPLDKEGNFRPSINHFKIPEIIQLDEARRLTAEMVERAFAEAAPGSREIELSAEALKELAASVPRSNERLDATSFFAQLAETDDGARLVINRSYSGLSLMFSRFIYPLEAHGRGQLLKGLRETLRGLQPVGAVFAEMQAAYDTNLNIHPPVTDYELLFPGEQSVRAPEEQLLLRDLYIEHDAASDSLHLYSKRLGKEVIPLYVGFLLPAALPHLRQVLLNFSFMSFSMMNLWRGVKGLPEVGDSIAYYPRVRYRNIVLQRASWKVATSYFPAQEPEQSDADYFLAVSRWRHENGIPKRVFVSPEVGQPKPAPPKEEEEEAAANADAEAKPQEKKTEAKAEQETGADTLILKPLYVDFDNHFCLQLLERVVSRTGRISLTEALPERDQLWFSPDGKSHVTELILELNSKRGGRHE